MSAQRSSKQDRSFSSQSWTLPFGKSPGRREAAIVAFGVPNTAILKLRGTRLTRHVEMSSKLTVFCRKAGIPSSGSTKKTVAGPGKVRAKSGKAHTCPRKIHITPCGKAT